MSKDYGLTLIGEIGDTTNEIGDSIPTETTKTVLCDIKSIIRSEHYAAAANGLRPEIAFEVNKYEYNGEQELIFNNKRYKVIRTYLPEKSKGIADFEDIELICQGVVNGVV